MSAKVEVTMTETVSYVAEYDLAEFAALLGCEPTVVAVRTAVEERPSSDYGVEDAEGLLDDVIERHFNTVDDRSWTITVGDEDADLPIGYRWATAEETERHSAEPIPGMIVVSRTADSTGAPYTQGEADLALPDVAATPGKGEVRCLVRKDTSPDPINCWYYNVDVEPADGGDLIQIDYGSLPTMGQALAACEYAVSHRDEFDNPEA